MLIKQRFNKKKKNKTSKQAKKKTIAGSTRSVIYLCVVSDVKSHIFTVANVAVLNGGTSTLAADTDG